MHHVTKHTLSQIENWLSALQWSSKSPKINPAKHLKVVLEWKIHSMKFYLENQQELCNAFMSTWTKECFQHLM